MLPETSTRTGCWSATASAAAGRCAAARPGCTMATASSSGGIDSASADAASTTTSRRGRGAVERQNDAPARQQPAVPPHPRQEERRGAQGRSSTHAWVNDGQSERDVLAGSSAAPPRRGRPRRAAGCGTGPAAPATSTGAGGPGRCSQASSCASSGPASGCFRSVSIGRARLGGLEPQSLPPVRQQPALQTRQLGARQLPGDRAFDQRPEPVGQRHRPARTPPYLACAAGRRTTR